LLTEFSCEKILLSSCPYYNDKSRWCVDDHRPSAEDQQGSESHEKNPKVHGMAHYRVGTVIDKAMILIELNRRAT
jgi:hypothetical protein